jgi:EAL domain-containing protein (putative c-di-GMP-specific phosphodiesterase class I)
MLSRRAQLEADLRGALRKDQFVLHFQPQVAESGALLGFEALLRWKHPELGLISPADFVNVAEETGLIAPIGMWILQQACEKLVGWAARPETASLRLSVNVSARQFRHPMFVEHALGIIRRSGVIPRRLRLELTESLLVDDVNETIYKMKMLKACGLGFSLDDFGTGYSSLSYLRRLPLDELKIDDSFFRNPLTRETDAAIIRTIVVLAQSLKLDLIAEGVEEERQRAFLSAHGCHAYQGYLFGGALDDVALNDYLGERLFARERTGA